ncbi:MAG: hypothetical protein KGJ35_01990, partial [Patescibacteria group bacterium]|nr:hypothetical protein [Patescibacteria group bacterium]
MKKSTSPKSDIGIEVGHRYRSRTSIKTTFHVITLFPGAFDSYLGESILKRAIEDGKIRVKFYNPRDFASSKSGKKKNSAMSYAERRVDDRPYGGGPGMVIEALPVIRAIQKAKGKKEKAKIVFFTPSGKQFTNATAESYKTYSDIVLVCGRYEGIDARVL